MLRNDGGHGMTKKRLNLQDGFDILLEMRPSETNCRKEVIMSDEIKSKIDDVASKLDLSVLCSAIRFSQLG